MKKLPQISEAEFEVMRIVWDQGPVSTNEVTDQLVQSTDWSPKTIQTLIRRLVTKGALTYKKKGRMFVYTAAVEEGEYLRSKTSSFVEHYFSGNISALVSSYLESTALSAEDIESLRDVLSEADKTGKDGKRMNIQIFGTNKSFDTKKAQRYFKERGIRFQMVDLKEKGMSRGEFDNVARAVGGWQNLVDPAAKDKQTLALLDALVDWQKEDKLFENQQLLKQPIVRNGRQATVGYQPEVWASWK